MNKRQINFYQFKGKQPFYFFPLMVILALLIIGVLAVFGLFIGIAVAVGVVVLTVLRLITSFGRDKEDKITNIEDGDTTTITLDESDYEIIEKEKKS